MITKAQRIQIVAWIRKGAPLKEGVQIYAGLPNKKRLVAALEKNAKQFNEQLNTEMCALLGITQVRFNQIIKEYGSKKVGSQKSGAGSRESEEKPATGNPEPGFIRKRSFRAEFPFLSNPSCPAELKALAADKITAWENYCAAHEKLFDCDTLDECYKTAFDVVENYKENRLIYEEFNYYIKHGVVLGKHNIFNKYKKFEHLRGLNVIDLVKLHEITLPHRIWRIESVIKQGDKPHLLGERQKRLNEVKAELGEVKRLLGIKNE